MFCGIGLAYFSVLRDSNSKAKYYLLPYFFLVPKRYHTSSRCGTSEAELPITGTKATFLIPRKVSKQRRPFYMRASPPGDRVG